MLTTQGLNEDKTVHSVVINEDVKIWKGEPFEQALTLHYVAVHWALQGSWDNARAAIGRSLFHLRDYGVKDTVELAEKAGQMETDNKGSGDTYLDNGYVAKPSDFALGHVMSGVTNLQLGVETGDDNRIKEASDHFHAAATIKADLKDLGEALKNPRGYNTILIVDYGRGPQKIATGRDNAVAKFIAKSPSDSRTVRVQTESGSVSWPWVCDVNAMATNHMWNNLQDVRLAKSYIGSALITAAAVTAASSNSRNSQYVALGLLAAGMAAKAAAHADTRHCEALPQRIFVVPAMVRGPDDAITLEIDGAPGTRTVLRGLQAPPEGRPAQLRYVRLIPGLPWMTPDRIVYSNDVTGVAPNAMNLPYILGGQDVRHPTEDVFESYQKSGHLTNMSRQDLLVVYRMEGIFFDARDNGGAIGLHVLDGGTSMIAPMAGSLGFNRLFGRFHTPYKPKTSEFEKAAEPWRLKTTTEPVKP